ncbi:M61 family peptidase [Dyella jejuensis]|uniref:M61 family peptidase n=1 Tax=Dyella jejuensis TaxID=1432009 RepID=A0ABW8JLS2_9GAMM
MHKRYAVALALLATSPAFGSAGPLAKAAAPALPVPVDRPYPGRITLEVDATDTRHKVYRVRESIPVTPGSLITLLYPQWETASHAPTGMVNRLAGLLIHAGDKPVQWRRDPYQPYAFQVRVPADASSLDLQFDFLSPATAREGALSMTPALINVQWQSMLLYPAGFYVRDIPFAATLRLPPGFTAFTALDAHPSSNGDVRYAPVSLEMLVDSPVYAGRYTRRIALTTDAHPVYLDLLADAPPFLAVPDATIARFTRTVAATERLFGTPPWQHYDMLVSLSDTFPGPGGVEHLASAENNLATDFFTREHAHLLDRDLIWHELVHAWNGKHRLPEGLWTPDFNMPSDDSLLWVYEGQTQFWGEVIAARSGERSRQDTLDMWAFEAATMLARRGRAWKSLADSSLDPVFDAGHHVAWIDWQRREDYYLEGPLFWLDVDATLRQKSGGRRSLDDLAHRFFQGADPTQTSTYSFADLCQALDGIAHGDWATFLRQKLNSHDDSGLLDGLAKNGYALTFTDTPTDYVLQSEQDNGIADFTFSIGLTVDANGNVRSLAWEGPAFRAGASIGTRIVAVNGQAFSAQNLKAAVADSIHHPVRLSISADGEPSTIEIPYRGPLRYPHLQRLPGTADGLAAILAPH